MILFTAIGCKDSRKTSEAQTTEAQTTEGTYTVVNDCTKVSFTACETTDKAAVRGVFKKDIIE
jgi:hypothetical protein